MAANRHCHVRAGCEIDRQESHLIEHGRDSKHRLGIHSSGIPETLVSITDRGIDELDSVSQLGRRDPKENLTFGYLGAIRHTNLTDRALHARFDRIHELHDLDDADDGFGHDL